MDLVRDLSSYFFLAGAVLVAAANLSTMRLKTAPPIGSGPHHWPWQLRGRYTRRGFYANSLGLVFWAVGVLVAVF